MGSAAHRRATVAAALAAALAIALLALALSSLHPRRAAAAPCPAPTILNLAGNLSISGTPPCDDDPETLSVFCGSGTVRFDYYVNSTFVGTADTATACGVPSRLSVYGKAGDDLVDLSRVSAANGFTGISQPNVLDGGDGADLLVASKQSNSISGGTGGDIVLMRQGAADTADCGADIDAVQADNQVTDSASSCEIADFLPTSARSAPNVAPHKKCKKKKQQRAKHRCKKVRAAT